MPPNGPRSAIPIPPKDGYDGLQNEGRLAGCAESGSVDITPYRSAPQYYLLAEDQLVCLRGLGGNFYLPRKHKRIGIAPLAMVRSRPPLMPHR
jgi:hypothetical protein